MTPRRKCVYDEVGGYCHVDFMLADRDYFLDLVGKIKSDPNALAACSGFSMDFATYDYVQ